MEQFEDNKLNTESIHEIHPPNQFRSIFEKMVKDMKFVGLVTLIYGVLLSLTIIGAVVGLPTIFIGIRIRESANQFAIFKSTNNASALKAGFDYQSKYFRLIKILIIIGLVLTAIYIVLIIVFFTSFLPMFFNHHGYQV